MLFDSPLDLRVRHRDDLFHCVLEARPRFGTFHVFQLGLHAYIIA